MDTYPCMHVYSGLFRPFLLVYRPKHQETALVSGSAVQIYIHNLINIDSNIVIDVHHS